MLNLLVQQAFAYVLDLLIIYLKRLPTSLHGYGDQALIKKVTTCAYSIIKCFFFSSICFDIIQSEVHI